MITGITHIAFRVRDIDRSVRFYAEVLGLPRLFDLNDSGGKPWITYISVANGQFIELFRAKEGFDPKEGADRLYHHLCLLTDDIYAAAEKIRQSGWSLDKEPSMGSDFNLQLWLSDPDGNPVEIMQIMPESEQGRTLYAK